MNRGITRRAALGLLAAGVASLGAEAAAKPQDGPRSYYDPAARTTVPSEGIFWKPSNAPVMYGRNIDMAVASDYARRIYGFRGGRESWVLDFDDGWPRGMCVFEGALYVVKGSALLVVDPLSGEITRRIDVPGYHAPINAVHLIRLNGHVWVTLAFDRGGTETPSPGASVHCLQLIDGQLVEKYRCPFNTVHPRHAEMTDLGLLVSDTFGGQVILVDTLVNRILAATTVYFPNSASLLPGGEVLICSEHGNRVFRWNVRTGMRSMVMSAPVAPFTDLRIDGHGLEALEILTADPKSASSPHKSKCSTESSGVDTLYSPNSAMTLNGLTLIADTDNHRVVVAREGRVITEVVGFNSPVNAVFI